MGCVLANNCLFGFPSYAEPPLVFRKPSTFAATVYDALLQEQEVIEMDSAVAPSSA
jgi:hypothetical protein